MARPLLGLLLVQVNAVKAPVFAVNPGGLIVAKGHTDISERAVITGVGLMVTVNVTGALVQPFAVAVTEIDPTISKLVRFAGAA